MNEEADRQHFFVLYPEQTSSANLNKCWNWFEPAHQSRGSGEPKLIVDMVNSVSQKYTIDTKRIFVAGLSAGAAMTVILGATYSDVFTCIGPAAGLEFKAATSTSEAFIAMSTGGPDPTKQGLAAYNAMPSPKKPVCVAVSHGTSDSTVNIVNGNQIVTQWIVTDNYVLCSGSSCNRIPTSPSSQYTGTVPGGRSYTVRLYNDSNNAQNFLKFVTVDGMGHAWPGGSSAGTYTDPKGPNFSDFIVKFFFDYTGGGAPTNAPTSPGPTTPPPPTHSPPTAAPSSSKTLTLPSIASESGYVGQILTDGASTSECKVGDKGMYNLDTYRTIYSFDTTAVPSNAVIKSAHFKFNREKLVGTVSSISIDLNRGGFGGSNQLVQSHYNSVASVTNAAEFVPPRSDGESIVVDLASNHFPYINRAGRTQIRLKGKTTASFGANTIFFACGNGASLVIDYE
eukprot:TRINITY_DN733_c0_g1_i1.p1 TRINITY_DN733_c0_g1~~TRINITY_DN733_c0_g1_i1.p1  ORF type:complete len:530 (-),score=96.15 TRINITY_DN733_c0_g1_i1:58-1416(-)